MAAALIVPAAAQAQDIGIEVACGLGDVGTSAVAAINPFATLTIDGSSVDLSACIRATGKTFTLDARFFSSVGNGTVHAEMNPDPFINFGATTTNLIPGTVTYAFLFGTPIVPGFYNGASSSGGVSVAPGAANDTHVTTGPIYPTYISGYGTLGLAATNLGVDNGTTACNATVANNTCNFALVSNSFAPAFYDNLEALLTYNQDDEQSVASWSGRVDLTLNAVPEPATVALTVTGLVALAGVARSRRRAA